MRLIFQKNKNSVNLKMEITEEAYTVTFVVPDDDTTLLVQLGTPQTNDWCKGLLKLQKGQFLFCMCALFSTRCKIWFISHQGFQVPLPPKVHNTNKSLGTLVLPDTKVSKLSELIMRKWYIQGLTAGDILSTGTPPGLLKKYTPIRKIAMVLQGAHTGTKWTCHCSGYSAIIDRISWNNVTPD